MSQTVETAAGSPVRRYAGSGFRPDIEGLRAVAIGLVLAYHAAPTLVRGGFVGVDVFFVISGFLITGLLVREIDRTGRISLRRFYARRARRLLPATAVVLVVTAILTTLYLPVTQRSIFGWDIASAALYVSNWRMADRSVDYLAEGIAPSPIQHFWSLAVEEQFYIVWPLLILAAILLARRSGWPLRRLLTGGILLVTLPSLAWSVHMTATNPAAAFFVTPTRLWELGIGALTALALPTLTRLGPRAGVWLRTIGIVVILGSGLLLTTAVPWPGTAALLPVLGTTLAIVGGTTAMTTDPVGRGLTWRPVVWIGGLSYSLYLWHWPLLVAAQAHYGELGIKRAALITALAIIPAWICHRLVENPIRFSPRLTKQPMLTLSIGANLTFIGLVAGLILTTTNPAPAPTPASAPQAVGAQVIVDDPDDADSLWTRDTAESITPSPQSAVKDIPSAYADHCQAPAPESDVKECVSGDLDGSRTVVLVGDSMAMQWQPALDDLGQKLGFRLVVVTKSDCPFTDAVVLLDGKPFTTCTEWNAAALSRVIEIEPDLVITSYSSATADPTGHDDGRSAMIQGTHSRWKTLNDAGIPVAVILKNSFTPGEIYECVAQEPENLSACAFPVSNPTESTQREAAEGLADTTLIDLNPYICPGDMCPAVIGNVLVYRQGSHLTRTYVMTLEPLLDEALRAHPALAAAP